ncbi:MAG: RagB/SusD family nutrient uptake outer membrane protein [Salinivirgaceae bacterium]|nr:RagB/SusD family nutrient uptake outer membrane protein [Salinivirgaceae bacterium]
MKKIYNSFIFMGLLGLALCANLTSCKDYLDREPGTSVSEEDAFKNFKNYQGFIEEIYNCIPDKEKCNWCPSWNWGDDEIFNPEADNRMTHQVDLGNFRAWSTTGNWLYRDGSDPAFAGVDCNAGKTHTLWPHSWYCIRKCNMAIENIDKMVGTDEERDLILGQAYFFRAWWHFELMEYFGGLPYISKVLDPSSIDKLPRLSFQTCADSCARDFHRAADLLPINWDNTSAGTDYGTGGKNELRVNKITALGYLGKCQLWAGSPLMKNKAQTGGAKTYDYDEYYCKRAAEAFGELLNMVEGGETQYALVEFNFSNIYDHVKASSAKTCYSDLFYTSNQSWKQPGSTEAIMRGLSGTVDASGPNANNSNWNTSKVFGPKVGSVVEHDNIIHQPTGNLVEMYGMANGLPLDDPESGFDKTHPFRDRDPRFYHDIVFDGFKYIVAAADKERQPYVYCELFTGGNMRSVALGSQTGYFIQKLVPHTCNIIDKLYRWEDQLHTNLSYMRLADVYLMYAEACAAVGGASYKSSNFDKTAEDAINTIRDRCGAGHVAAKYVADRNKFIDEVRRERAVELSFEGFRFNDLQRWLLLTEYPYNTKYATEFTRVNPQSWYEDENNDPRDAEVVGYSRRVILTRNFGVQHYWFPLLDDDVYIYADFAQNPGW